MFYRSLTGEENRVIVDKTTESPFSGEYNNRWEKGMCACTGCEATLLYFRYQV